MAWHLVYIFLEKQTNLTNIVHTVKQTWNLSQAPQACLCKIILVRVNVWLHIRNFYCNSVLSVYKYWGQSYPGYTINKEFQPLYMLTCFTGLFTQEKIMLTCFKGLFTQEKIIEDKYTHKKILLIELYHLLCCFVAVLCSLRFTNFWVKFGVSFLTNSMSVITHSYIFPYLNEGKWVYFSSGWCEQKDMVWHQRLYPVQFCMNPLYVCYQDNQDTEHIFIHGNKTCLVSLL